MFITSEVREKAFQSVEKINLNPYPEILDLLLKALANQKDKYNIIFLEISPIHPPFFFKKSKVLANAISLLGNQNLETYPDCINKLVSYVVKYYDE